MFKNTITAIFSVLMIGLAVFSGASAVRAQSDTDKEAHIFKKEVEEVYAEIDKITVEKNVEVIESFLAPNFTAKRDGKEISRAEFLKYQTEAAKNIKDITFAETTIEHFEAIEDDLVTVKSSQKLKVVFKDGKEEEVVTRSAEQWEKTKDGWKLLSTENLDDK